MDSAHLQQGMMALYNCRVANAWHKKIAKINEKR
jgi:hypothetical protein